MTNDEEEFAAADADTRDDDDLIDRLIEHNPQFRRLIEERRDGDTVPIDEARRRLD